MSDAGGSSILQQGQAELARQVTRQGELLGTISAQLSDRVTHRELMQEFGGFRKEFSGKLDHMEEKFDAAADRVDGALDKAVDRIKEGLTNLASKAVADAMAIREAQETKAALAVQNREADIDRRIRRADRNGYIGGGVGIVGILYAIYQTLSGGG